MSCLFGQVMLFSAFRSPDVGNFVASSVDFLFPGFVDIRDLVTWHPFERDLVGA